MENKKLITFIEPAGRTILAEYINQTDTRLEVKNPVILHVQPEQTGRLNIQTFPLYFRELLTEAGKATGTTWSYPLNATVVGTQVDVEARLTEAYFNLWNPKPAQTQAPKTVKLFDDVVEK